MFLFEFQSPFIFFGLAAEVGNVRSQDESQKRANTSTQGVPQDGHTITWQKALLIFLSNFPSCFSWLSPPFNKTHILYIFKNISYIKFCIYIYMPPRPISLYASFRKKDPYFSSCLGRGVPYISWVFDFCLSIIHPIWDFKRIALQKFAGSIRSTWMSRTGSTLLGRGPKKHLFSPPEMVGSKNLYSNYLDVPGS